MPNTDEINEASDKSTNRGSLFSAPRWPLQCGRRRRGARGRSATGDRLSCIIISGSWNIHDYTASTASVRVMQAQVAAECEGPELLGERAEARRCGSVRGHDPRGDGDVSNRGSRQDHAQRAAGPAALVFMSLLVQVSRAASTSLILTVSRQIGSSGTSVAATAVLIQVAVGGLCTRHPRLGSVLRTLNAVRRARLQSGPIAGVDSDSDDRERGARPRGN